jgi:hypothetical protein
MERPPTPDPVAEAAAYEAANVAMWARSSDTERVRVGRHAERGSESYDLSFRLIAGHDRFHLGQARRALDALNG